MDVIRILTGNRTDVNCKVMFGETSLLFAAKNGYFGVVKLPMEPGANIEAKDNGGNTSVGSSLLCRNVASLSENKYRNRKIYYQTWRSVIVHL